MKARRTIAFFGSSLTSAYWNGAATYYRGLIKALAARNFDVTFYEPDAYDRLRHRDLEPPPWAKVVVYSGSDPADAYRVLEQARSADVLVKASGVGVFDDLLTEGVLAVRRADALAVYWDVDAAATLAELAAHPEAVLRQRLPEFDIVFTYGGGPPVVEAYEQMGARWCVPIYNALDPETHHRVAPDARFTADLAFLANRLPDREVRARAFFFDVAAALPKKAFLLGGNGWEPHCLPANIKYVGHVYTRDHNAFNSTPLAVLNVARDSMADMGYSPATRVFEAAGAGACIITDAWKGVDCFLEPGKEIFVARNGDEVVDILSRLDVGRARAMGEAVRRRVLAEHTYERRAEEVVRALDRL